MRMRIWTLGHSTKTIDELVDILRHYRIEVLVDVRTVPRSRTNPQFNKNELERVLPERGIEYIHQKDLGGLRRPLKDSPNIGWHNESFRGFADYMGTDEFEKALSSLIDLAKIRRVAVMCAELLPWRCHRSLIADALLIRGFDVEEILNMGKSQLHKLTPFAVVDGHRLRYPPEEILDPTPSPSPAQGGE